MVGLITVSSASQDLASACRLSLRFRQAEPHVPVQLMPDSVHTLVITYTASVRLCLQTSLCLALHRVRRSDHLSFPASCLLFLPSFLPLSLNSASRSGWVILLRLYQAPRFAKIKNYARLMCTLCALFHALSVLHVCYSVCVSPPCSCSGCSGSGS